MQVRWEKQGYLSSQLFHEGLQLTEQVVALMEERQVGVHKGQHLEWRKKIPKEEKEREREKNKVSRISSSL